MTTPKSNTPNTNRLVIIAPFHNPAPQGSKAYKGHRYNRRLGKRVPVLTEASARLKPWRDHVADCTRKVMATRGAAPMDGSVRAEVIFTMEPPSNRPKKRRTWPNTQHYGDLDKLLRGCLDGITQGKAIIDDSRITWVATMKLFPGDPGALDAPGTAIRLTRIDTWAWEGTTPTTGAGTYTQEFTITQANPIKAQAVPGTTLRPQAGKADYALNTSGQWKCTKIVVTGPALNDTGRPTKRQLTNTYPGPEDGAPPAVLDLADRYRPPLADLHIT